MQFLTNWQTDRFACQKNFNLSSIGEGGWMHSRHAMNKQAAASITSLFDLQSVNWHSYIFLVIVAGRINNANRFQDNKSTQIIHHFVSIASSTQNISFDTCAGVQLFHSKWTTFILFGRWRFLFGTSLLKSDFISLRWRAFSLLKRLSFHIICFIFWTKFCSVEWRLSQ